MEQAEEAKALEMLRNNGLVQTSVAKNENYARFEIIDEKLNSQTEFNKQQAPTGLAPLKRLPPRLERSLHKPQLTSEQISRKLEEANERKTVSLRTIKK